MNMFTVAGGSVVLCILIVVTAQYLDRRYERKEMKRAKKRRPLITDFTQARPR